jgi:mannose-6-phosphate isomerase-like protein (cupin superfamily)
MRASGISLRRNAGKHSAENVTQPLEREIVVRAGLLLHAHKHGETLWKVLHGRMRVIRAENGS